MTDNAIVQLYLDRDETAITVTEDKYGEYLRCIAHRILSNESDEEESVNDTYMAAWNSIPPHIPTVLSTYLGKLTRRISIDRYRHRHRDKRAAGEYALSLEEWSEVLSDNNSPENELDAKELSSAIDAFLRSLSSEERHLFLGRYYYFDPLKTVAKYCGMSETKAKSKLFRLRQRLKAYLQKEGWLHDT